jgi:cell division initiation protein
MFAMEITARELRDVEIREAFRGYHRDDVNDLLERAAATIDTANERLRQMSERLGSAQVDSGRSRETEDILHRTLLLAQRAADEAVAEAQAKARQMIDEADTQARRTISEAEAEARIRGESERRRLEQEVLDLANRRDALTSDIDVLSRYESDYRDRLLGSLERDLEMLRSGTVASPGPRPEVHAIDLPVASERVLRRDDAGPVTREIDVRSVIEETPATPSMPSMPGASSASHASNAMASVAPPSSAPAPTGAMSNGFVAAGPASGAPMGGAPSASVSAPSGELSSASNGDARAAIATEARTIEVIAPEAGEVKRAPAAIDLLAAEGNTDEVLDDDAFFATLREAVHDEGMPGPRDEDDQSSLFDQDDADPASFKDVFRRRR